MTELRVHGVLGTTPEALVDTVSAVDVAGDGIGRIVRPADRLRHPAEGPPLAANGAAVGRTVEGYVWGGMTSGGLAKATWTLLFPFSLSNVAHWMLPPVPDGNRVAAVFGAVARALLRLAALLLTMLFVGQVAVVSLDLIATQCLAPGSPCLDAVVSPWLREQPLVRPAIGLIPVLLLVLLLHKVSTVSWVVDTPGAPAANGNNRAQRMPGANLVSDPDTPALRALHTVASFAVVAMIALGGPLGRAGSGFPAVLWVVTVVLLAVTMVGVLMIDDPSATRSARIGRWVRAGLGPVPRGALIGLGLALVLAVAAVRHPLPAKLSGTDATVEIIAALLVAVCAVFAVLLIPCALLARHQWSAQPRELRPWAGGWMAAPMLAIAGLLGAGFGAGLGIAVRALLFSPVKLELPAGYESITLLWGVGATLAALVGVLGFAAMLVIRWREERAGVCPPVAGLLHEGCASEDVIAAGRAWRGARLQQRHTHHVLLALAAVLSGGTAVAIDMRLRELGAPEWLQPFTAVGVVALAALAIGLLRMIYVAARRPATARYLGLLADLACFWPREAHPTVPPCYALKVVPELAARAMEHLRDPDTRVVLTGHSQGSLLVAVTAARLVEALPKADVERIGIITAGSQLQWAYPRAFPCTVPHASLVELHGRLDGRWRALCRGTDPLGGAVTTWRRQVFDGSLLGVGFRTDGTSGPLASATRSPRGGLVLGGDHWLLDPQREPIAGRRWAPGVLGHGDYVSDPEWDRAVALAAGLDPDAGPATEPDAVPELGGVQLPEPTKPADEPTADQGERAS